MGNISKLKHVNMSSATALLQSSDVESLKSESSSTQFLNVQIQNENLEQSWGNATKFLVSAESKLRVKPLSLKFKPRYESAGDQYWKAAQELYKFAQFSESCSAMQKSAACYSDAGHYIRAAKVLDHALSTMLQKCQEDVKISQLMNIVDGAHSLYLKINQLDDAVRVLEVAANHFLENNFSKEQFDKGLGLLRRAVGILENEGRPAQAGNLAMKMLSLGLNSEIVGSEMTDLGKTCLKMLVMTNNVMMTGNCLILTTLLFIKHFENVALDEIKLLYRDNAGNVSKEVQEFMKIIIKALEDRNFTKIEDAESLFQHESRQNHSKCCKNCNEQHLERS